MNEPVRTKAFRKGAVLCALAAIFVASVWYRVNAAQGTQSFDPADPLAFYWTENALQYHYAELIARGQGIPACDLKLQVPDGVLVFENLTILMEYPVGLIYRWLNLERHGMRFHRFTIVMMAFFASLMVIAVFLICRAIDYSRITSLLACSLWAFSMVSVQRSIGGFLNEDFALPFLFLGIAGTCWAMKSRRTAGSVAISVLAGLAFAVGLAGWHLSRFIFLGFIAAMIAAVLLNPLNSQRTKCMLVLAGVMVFPCVAAALVPVLRSRLFIVSPAMLLGMAAVMSFILTRPQRDSFLVLTWRGIMFIAAALVIAMVPLVLIKMCRIESTYEHVWSLLFDKLKFFGVKPGNPNALSYISRTLWIEDFNSPGWSRIVLDFFPMIIASVFGFPYLLTKMKKECRYGLILVLAVLFVALYVFIARIGIIANAFLSILAAGVTMTGSGRRPARNRSVLAAAFISCVLLFNLYHGLNYHRQTWYVSTLQQFGGEKNRITFSPARIDNIDVVRFIRQQTPENASFLARYGVGPLILAYADRGIPLQPKFEVAGCQERVARYLNAVYGTEQELYELCCLWQVDYFLYDTRIVLDHSTDSDRWVADRLDLSKHSVCFYMQFAPESLKHFSLQYQNPSYRVFKIVRTAEEDTGSARPEIFPQPVYDLTQYGGQSLAPGAFNDRCTDGNIMRLNKARVLLIKASVVLAKDPHRAANLMEESRSYYPGLIGSTATIGVAYVLAGREQEGYELCVRAARENPLLPVAHYNLGYAMAVVKNDMAGALAEIKKALALDPGFAPARELLENLKP